MFDWRSGPEGASDDPVLERLQNPLPLHHEAHPPIQPVRDGEVLIVNNSLSVKALNLYSKSLVWEFRGPMLAGLPAQNWFGIEKYVQDRRDDDIFHRTVSVGLVTSATVARGVVLANLQVPEPWRDIDTVQRIVINPAYPWRGLYALDLDDGSLLWAQRGEVVLDPLRRIPTFDVARASEPDHDVAPRLNVLGPAAVVDDRVYALGHFIEGAVNSHLLVMDLFDGSLIHSVPLVIGQQELSMFGMPFQEFTSGMPVVADGTVFCPTHLGLMAAVDLVFGDLRWLASYDAIDIESPPNYYMNAPREVYWYHNPPMVLDDRLVVTPFDSKALHVLDTRTGRAHWQYSVADAPFRRRGELKPSAFLLGELDGALVVQQDERVTGVDLASGVRRWQESLRPNDRTGRRPEAFGRGCIAAGQIYVPLMDRLAVLDTEGVERESHAWPGTEQRNPLDRRMRFREDPEVVAGNVLVFPDLVVSANRYRISVGFDVDSVLRSLRTRLAAEGESPSLLLRIAGLVRRTGRLEEAVEHFERGLELASAQGSASPDLRLLERGLCETRLELCREQLDAGRRVAAWSVLEAAERTAFDDDLRLEVTELLLAELVDQAPVDVTLEWLERLRQRHATERRLFPRLSGHPLPIGLMVSVERARLFLGESRAREALEELQRLHLEHGDEQLFGMAADAYAGEQIERLLAMVGSGLREEYDAAAWAAFEDAFSQGDLERLSLLRRRYANASNLDRFTARFVSLLRDRGRFSDMLVAGADLLAAESSTEEVNAAIEDMIEVAVDVGNLSYARALLRAQVEAGVQPQLGPEVEARLRGREVPVIAPTAPPREIATFEMRTGEQLINGTLRGEPLGDYPNALVLDDDLRLRAVVPDDDTEAWNCDIGESSRDLWYREFLHAAGVLVVHAGDLSAVDLENGALLWRRGVQGSLQYMLTTDGVLLLLEQRASGREDGIDELLVTALEPHSGAELWRHVLRGNGILKEPVVRDGRMAVVTLGDRNELEILDAVTGRRVFALGAEVAIPSQASPILLPGRGGVLVPRVRAEQGAMLQQRPDFLSLYRIPGNEEVHRIDLVETGGRYTEVFETGDTLVLEMQEHLLALDGESAELREVIELPPLLPHVQQPEGGDRSLLVALESRPTESRRRLHVYDDRLMTRFETAVPIERGAISLERFKYVVQRGDQLLMLARTRLPASVAVDWHVVAATDGTVLESRRFDLGGHSVHWSLCMAGSRILLVLGNSVHVLSWE